MRFTRGLVWCVAIILAVGCGAVVLAQGRGDIADAGSLAALTAEIRQLRLAVEESTRSQTQTQALGVYLSAQQSRILQVGSRLDAARKELDGLTSRYGEIAMQVASMEADLPQVSEQARRSQIEAAIHELRAEQQRVLVQQQQAASREAEISQAMRVEESRWTDLISRLEQLIKK